MKVWRLWVYNDEGEREEWVSDHPSRESAETALRAEVDGVFGPEDFRIEEVGRTAPIRDVSPLH